MKVIKIYFFLFLVPVCFILGQQNIINSDVSLDKNEKLSIKKIDRLNYSSGDCWGRGRYDSALVCADSALIMAKQINYKQGMAEAYSNRGTSFWYKGNYPEALDNYFRELKMHEQSANKEAIANSYHGIGNVYSYIGNSAQALNYYAKSLQIRLQIGDKIGIANSYNNIGLIYFEKHNYRMALDNYYKSLKLKKEAGDKKGIADSYGNIGAVYNELGKYELALENHYKCIAIEQETGDKDGIAETCNDIAKVYIKVKLLNKAIEYSTRALVLSRETGSKTNCKDAYKNLSAAYLISNDFKNAFEYNQLYTQLKDSMSNSDITAKAAQLQQQYDSEKENEIRQLAEQKKEAEHQTEIERQKIMRNGFVAGFLFVLLFSFFIFRNYRQKQRSAKIIEAKNHELERLSIVASETDNVILIMSPNGTIEWANEMFTRLNGISIEELKRKKGETIFDISNNPMIRKVIDAAVSEKRSVVYESLNLNKEGKRIWESSTLTPIFATNGTLKKIIIIDTDISKRKEAEDLVKEKNKDILDSIYYARRIQRSLLPTEKYITNQLRRLMKN